MEALRFNLKLCKSGEISLRNLPLRKGDDVEVMVIYDHKKTPPKKSTAARLLKTDAVGLWADRKDIRDSIRFARSLRQKAQQRSRPHDPA